MDFLFRPNSLMPRLAAIACSLCILVFVGLQMSGSDSTWAQAMRWGYYPPGALWEGQPWALISSVFVHLEIWHIAFNLYWLWILGNALEDAIGVWKWVVFFLGAAWVSSALQLLISGDTGIGMSGVGYALFGFGWVARRKIPAFERVLDDRTSMTFFIWLVGCAVATQLGWIRIANAAHVGGLAFGAAIAAVWVFPKRRLLSCAGLVALLGLSVLPIFWCPRSSEWTRIQAEKAHDKRDYASAIVWYQRSMARGIDETWGLSNLAIIYGYQRNAKAYAQTLAQLRKFDAKAATKVEADYGPPVPGAAQ